MAAVAIVGNKIVLLGRCFHKNRNNVEHSLYLTHLAASDLLMGIYLAIIAIVDINFRGSYIVHEEAWRHSKVCALCGELRILYYESFLKNVFFFRLLKHIKLSVLNIVTNAGHLG